MYRLSEYGDFPRLNVCCDHGLNGLNGAMTIEELKAVKFRETCHMALESEYTTTYMSEDGRLGFCDHVPRDKYGMVKKGGRAVRHFMIDGKVYKTKAEFLEAIEKGNPEKK